MIGAISGGLVGVLCGTYGTMAGILAPRGKARGLVLGMHIALLALGVTALMSGLVAVTLHQPRHVWYPLLLTGGICSIVLGVMLPVIVRRYRQADARRLEAEELRRST